jgi:hypothetical protein
MPRVNACSELTKFGIEVRHGYLVTESIPVSVPYGQSDIDILAVHPTSGSIRTPRGDLLGGRIIIESKDEHDFDPKGTVFGNCLKQDTSYFGEARFVPTGTSAQIKFTMLRQAHFEKAASILGTGDFDRLFVVHAIDQAVLDELRPLLARRRIFWLTIPEIVRDLELWYRAHPRPTGLRHSPVGDMLHLLLGYCGVSMPLDQN